MELAVIVEMAEQEDIRLAVPLGVDLEGEAAVDMVDNMDFQAVIYFMEAQAEELEFLGKVLVVPQVLVQIIVDLVMEGQEVLGVAVTLI